MPDPARGLAGDPSWDPDFDKKLEARADAAEQEWIKAHKNLEAAQKAAKAAQDAAAVEKGKSGGGGFPPPRKK